MIRLGTNPWRFVSLISSLFYGPVVPFGLEDFFQDNAMLINRAPQPESIARNLYGNFVQVPDVAGPPLPPPQVPRDLRNLAVQRRIDSYETSIPRSSSISSTSRRLKLNRIYNQTV